MGMFATKRRFTLAVLGWFLLAGGCEKKPSSTPPASPTSSASSSSPAPTATTPPAGAPDSHEQIQTEMLQAAQDFKNLLSTIKAEADLNGARPKLEELAQRHEALAGRVKRLAKPTREQQDAMQDSFGQRFKGEGDYVKANLARINKTTSLSAEVMPYVMRIGRAADTVAVTSRVNAGPRKVIRVVNNDAIRAPSPPPRISRATTSPTKVRVPEELKGQFARLYSHNVAPFVTTYGEDHIVTLKFAGVPRSNVQLVARLRTAFAPLKLWATQEVVAPSGSMIDDVYVVVAPVDDLQAFVKQLRGADIGNGLYDVDEARRLVTTSVRGADPKLPGGASGAAATGSVTTTGVQDVGSRPGVKGVHVASNAFALAVIPTSGTVAAVDPVNDVVRLYPKLMTDGSTEKIERPVGGSPCAVIHKRVGEKGYLLVLCAASSSVYVLDDTTFDRVTTIELGGESLWRLAAAESPDVKLAFYTRRGSRADVGQIDLEKFRDLGPLKTGEAVSDVAVSADGTMLYARQSGARPAGTYAFSLRNTSERESPRVMAELVTRRREDSESFVADPFNQTASSGNRLLSFDLNTDVAALPAVPMAYMTTRPVFFAAEGTTLLAMSANTLGVLDKMRLPFVVARTPDPNDENNGNIPKAKVGHWQVPYASRVLVDERHGTVLVWSQNQGVLIPLSSLKLGNEPNLAVQITGGSRDLAMGQAASLRVQKLDPAATLELRNAPEGMTLAGDTIAWTPTARQIGQHSAELRVAGGGGIVRTRPLTLEVSRPCAELDFVPTNVTMSPDGSLVLAVGTRPPVGRGPGNQDNCRLAVIDAKSLRVVADRTLNVASHVVAIDRQFVYVSMRDANAFYVLSTKDLSDVRRLFTESRVRSFRSIGDKRLFVQSVDRKPIAVFTLPTFEPDPIGEIKWMAGNVYDDGDPINPFPVHGGWVYEGVVYDPSFTKVRMLIAPRGLPPVVAVAGAIFDRPLSMIDPKRLGVWTYPPPERGERSNLNSGESAILEDRPAIVTLSAPPEPGNDLDRPNQPPAVWKLGMRDLLTLTAIGGAELPLTSIPAARWAQYHNPARAVATAADKLAVQIVNRIWVVPTSDLPETELAAPLQFALATDRVLLDLRRPTVVSTTLRGGKKPYRFALPTATPTPGVEVDKATGKVTIDPRELQLVKAATAIVANVPVPEPASLGTRAAAYMRQVTPRFRALIGRDPVGVPLAVRFSVRGQDAEQQSTRLDFAIIAEVPVDALEEAVGGLERDGAGRPATRSVGRPTTRPVSRPVGSD